MNDTEINPQQQAERLKSWIEMLSFFPSDSPEGRQRDGFWEKSLQLELAAVERRLQIDRTTKTANSLLLLTKKVNALCWWL